MTFLPLYNPTNDSHLAVPFLDPVLRPLPFADDPQRVARGRLRPMCPRRRQYHVKVEVPGSIEGSQGQLGRRDCSPVIGDRQLSGDDRNYYASERTYGLHRTFSLARIVDALHRGHYRNGVSRSDPEERKRPSYADLDHVNA